MYAEREGVPRKRTEEYKREEGPEMGQTERTCFLNGPLASNISIKGYLFPICCRQRQSA